MLPLAIGIAISPVPIGQRPWASGSTPYLIAGAYLGAIDAMMARRVARGGHPPALRETETLLERLRPIWPAGS